LAGGQAGRIGRYALGLKLERWSMRDRKDVEPVTRYRKGKGV